MEKIFYNVDGWVCERYPYDIPIDNVNRYIEVDEETHKKTLSCEVHKAWKVENGVLVVRQKEAVPSRELYEQELAEIQLWFALTDYIPNKIIVEEWQLDDPRFIAYKQERLIKRARQDELIELLK